MIQSYRGDRPRSRRASAEWIQAITGLVILSMIFATVQGTPFSSTPEVKAEAVSYQNNPYWNSELGYGFQGKHADLFVTTVSTADTEKLTIQNKDGEVYKDSTVRISYYRNSTIENIEKDIPVDVPRAYSRLPGGIAVIEGDLSSESAKLVFATLHSR